MDSLPNITDFVTKENLGTMFESSRLVRQVNDDILTLILLDAHLEDLVLTPDEAIQALATLFPELQEILEKFRNTPITEISIPLGEIIG